MGQPNYEGWSLEKVGKAILAGDPDSFDEAITAFDTTNTSFSKLQTDGGAAVGKCAGVENTWVGPAADAFLDFSGKFFSFVNKASEPLAGYKGALEGAQTALRTAKGNITSLQTQAGEIPKDEIDQKKFDEAAVKILNTLAGSYRDAIGQMKEIAATPEDLPKGGGGGADGKHGDHDNKGGGDDKGDGQDKHKDEHNDESKDGHKDEDKKSNGGPAAGGGGAPEKGNAKGPGKGPAPTGPGGGTGPKSSLTGPDGTGGDGKGHDSPKEGPKQGPGAGGPNPTTPVSNGSPLTPDHRALPDAPLVTKDGVKGVDVNGDGKPDLGLDGKPLPGTELVTKDGLKGVDVNGDGKPDIGVDGEILKHAPIVQGPDGKVGVDVNGDGKPDVGISGQMLPDAPIVTHDGVRGLDVDGDGKPDLGMDGKPLPGAETVTKDGVKGVDVNCDGKPDIGMDGKILKDAPIATSPDGIKGVDVNEDGKPDIALTHDGKRGTDSITSPHLQNADRPGAMPPAMASTGTSAPPAHYSTIGLGAPGPDSPSTVLTSAGPQAAALGTPATAVPPGPAVPAAPAAAAPAGLGVVSPVAGVGAMGAIGAAAGVQKKPSNQSDDDDVWDGDPRGPDAALGRPRRRKPGGTPS